MILHEIYFAGIGAPNRPGVALASAIERDFGSEAQWRAEFAAMGKALGGGSDSGRKRKIIGGLFIKFFRVGARRLGGPPPGRP